MNKIQKEWLAILECARIYYRYRKAPLEYYHNWEFRKKIETDLELWRKENINKIKQFKDKYLGEDCFIIGNGPSLNKMDLLPLNNYYIFGLNKIFLIFKRVKLDLDFLVSVNPLVIEQSIEEFKKLSIPKFLSYSGVRNHSIDDENVIKIFTYGGLESTGNLEYPINEGYTVTNVALQIAYYLGFRNVYLIGVDHNFKQIGKPNEEQTMGNDDVNHFDPNYFKGHKWHLADLEGSDLAYRNTKFLFDRSNRKIFDATINGNLNVFEKIEYSNALSNAKRKQV